MTYIKKYWRLISFTVFIFGNIFLWYAIYREAPTNYLTIAFLNIGQGDAIYIESPTHTRMMVDGGPPHAVLGELAKVLPFYARSIDTLLITNPDADHFSGFIDILKADTVSRIIEPGTKTDTQTYQEFKKIVAEKNIPDILGKRGMILHLGGGAELDILFPDQDVSTWATNDGSIVARLVYKNNSVMLTGDAPNKTEEYVMSLDPTGMKSTILKAGHHGSRTSASESFVQAVDPQYAVISAGFHNKYGHPHKETMDLFNSLHIPTLITFEKGTIIMKSDGTQFQTRFVK